MADYQAMYSKIFNAVTDVERQLLETSMRLQQSALTLRAAQLDCEELFLATDDTPED